jgi:hypothetical protein
MSVSSLAMKPDIPSVRSPLAEGIDPSVLASIYDEDLNIAVWQRTLAPNLQQVVASFVEVNPTFKASMTVTANNALPSLIDDLGKTEAITPLAEDIARLVEMFCCLFV